MFDALRQSLQLAPQPPAIFFRDDDADRDLPELRTLLDLFCSRGLALSLAVIPGTLTEDGARLLSEAAAAAPALELHQHGWMHVNHEPQGRKCEFGPSRSFAEQFLDIASGRQRLAELLGPRVAPIFTPPWNRCTADTARALEQLHFAALSKDLSPAVGRIREISIAVDIFTWKSGPQLKSPEQIAAELSARLAQPGPLGILLHHKVMNAEAFALTAQLVDALRPASRFYSLEAACSVLN